MPTYRPRWRDCNGKPGTISDADFNQQCEWAADRLLQIADVIPTKASLLVKEFRKFPASSQIATIRWLETVDPASIDSERRNTIWDELRDLVQKHRFFPHAWWVLPISIIDELEKIQTKFAPSDVLGRNRWLFSTGTFDSFGTSNTPHEERDRLEAIAQDRAIREVFECLGLIGILTLAEKAQKHKCIRIGQSLANLISDWRQVLPEILSSEKEFERSVAIGYAIAKYSAEGNGWLEALPLETWNADVVGRLALILPVRADTWKMLRRRKPHAEAAYWRNAHPWTKDLSDDDLLEIVAQLLRHGRPFVAVDVLSMEIHSGRKPKWEIVAGAVECACRAPLESTDNQTMTVYHVCELMKFLQAEPAIDPERLVSLEWRLLPLSRHESFVPTVLHAELARHPAFFVEVLCAIYREQPSPEEANLANAARNLLDSWKGIPGFQPDGTIRGETLREWVFQCREECKAKDRIAICDVKIGEQLSYAPPDLDGFWPPESVREIFEMVPTNEILRGFETGVFNQRGVTSRAANAGGEQERTLVLKYRGLADKCKVAWPRTALALRRLAETYEADAQQHDSRAEGQW
jgi:hypothetical protein